MYKIILSGILFFATVTSLRSQERKDFNYYNTLTYNQYLARDWNRLLKTGRESLHLGYDSYYIRMRLGIALYSKNKYMLAEKQFRKATGYDSNHPAPKEYLHYAMILTNRQKEADTFYPLEKEPKIKFVNNIYLESGIKASDGTAATRNIYYGLFSLRHGFSKRVTYFQAFEYLVRDYVNETSGTPPAGHPGDLLQTRQYEYYGALEILAGHGFYITPAFHTQRITMEGYYWNNFVLSLGLSQHAGITNIYARASYSRIDQEHQYQGSLGLTIYPLANLNFYIDNLATVQYESGGYHPAIKQKIGGKVLKKTWLEGWYSYGDLRYFNEQNAFVVFNTPNTIHNRIGGGIIQGMGKHTLYLQVIREYKEDNPTGKDFSHLDFIIGVNFNLQ